MPAMAHFKLVSSCKASDVVPVSKYVSEKTGITVIIAEVEGPLVNGFFCLATEAHDDDGLPHTLEHLIFLGSKRYPYKGVLDLLANRCMANGTNAWTDTDHTCYTIYTAGAAGMLSLIPIYLDHILMPVLTDEGFTTEVCHIDGDGQVGGVVYCEMQGRENMSDSLCSRRLLQAMYPNSGYSSETGGLMENLRSSTTNPKVRSFHKKFYRPENLTVILTGQIDAADVFKAMQVVEDDIIAQRKEEIPEAWVRPWQTIPPKASYSEHVVEWPSDVEDCGQVSFGWRGPLMNNPSGIKELTSCAILLRYLSETAMAPLQQCIVEIEDALAGDVTFNIIENLATLLKIQLENVPINKLKAARDQALKCIKDVRSGSTALDMDRMATLLKKQLREGLCSLETDPHHSVAFRCIGDLLYSQNEADFASRMNPQIHLKELLQETADYWLGLLTKYFTDDYVTIIGKPSIELQAKLLENDNKRIEAQKLTLGESGLAKKAEALEKAMEYNERPPPDGTISSVEVPSCGDLSRHSLQTWHSLGEPCPMFDLKSMPMYTRVHSLKTNFVYINLLFDTTSCTNETRKWLPLLVSSAGEWAAGERTHTQVVADTERLTVVLHAGLGAAGGSTFRAGAFGNFLRLSAKCEPSDYEELVHLLNDMLYSAKLTKERLLVFAQRLINEVAQVRKDGYKMVHDTLLDSLYSENSNNHWCSVLRQHKFLKQVIERLTGDEAEAVVREASEALVDATAKPWLHISTDLERFKLPTAPWRKFVTKGEIQEPRLYWDSELMSGWGSGFVVGVGGVESNYLMQLSEGPLDASADDVASLIVVLNYFTQLEGPMWRQIRGAGLSYGYSVRLRQHEGCLMFSLYKATNVVAAYTKAKAILESHLSDGTFDDELFMCAKNTSTFDTIEQEKCPADVVENSLINYCKRLGEHYNKELVCALRAVSPAAARSSAARWLPALLAPERAAAAVVCHPAKTEHTRAALARIGVKMKAYASIEDSHFNQ